MNWSLPLNICVCLLFCPTSVTVADESAEQKVTRPVLEVTSDITLDPGVIYGAIVVRASGVTIDGNGAWLLGTSECLCEKQGQPLQLWFLAGWSIHCAAW